MKDLYKKGGKKKSSKKMPKKADVKKEAKREKESFMEESKELSFGSPKRPAPDMPPMQQEVPPQAANNMMSRMMMKKGGAKSMEPGGGGRFAKMVKSLKKEGKSADSAKAIAASIGRKKYGKSKFQAMAAAGKKKMGGAKC